MHPLVVATDTALLAVSHARSSLDQSETATVAESGAGRIMSVTCAGGRASGAAQADVAGVDDAAVGAGQAVDRAAALLQTHVAVRRARGDAGLQGTGHGILLGVAVAPCSDIFLRMAGG